MDRSVLSTRGNLTATQAAMVANMMTHMSYFQSQHLAMLVEQRPDLTLIDSGLACDTYNFVCRARLVPESAASRIREAIGHFRQAGRPFAWWVSPGDGPAALPDLLVAAGLTSTEPEPGMAMDLTKLPPPPAVAGLRVERASSPQQLADYANILAALWNPPDSNVITFYEKVRDIALAANCPLRFHVGYADGQPVAASELCLADGVAGLYNIATLDAHRRKGYGTALTLQPLYDARDAGVTVATLQASPDGYGVYKRIGFETIAQFTEYQPSVA